MYLMYGPLSKEGQIIISDTEWEKELTTQSRSNCKTNINDQDSMSSVILVEVVCKKNYPDKP